MIVYKTQQEIELLAEGGRILGQILHKTANLVKPGIGTKELNDFAEKLILEQGGRPAFKNFKTSADQRPFPTTLCTSINDEIVHAPAEPDRILKDGDIIGLDIGMEYKGLFTDTAVTVAAGKISKEAKKLLEVTKTSLALAIKQFKEGNALADLAKAIQDYVEPQGFSIVRELVGHGVGKEVHEEPKVPNYVTEEAKHVKIKKGLVIAIEPMINVGDWRIDVLDNNWTFVTRDKSLSAQFEHTVALDHNGKVRIITKP